MFVSKRKYNDVIAQLAVWRTGYQELLVRYNELVTIINAKGGQDFLNSSPSTQLSEKQIKSLLFLCHPDKHDNSEKATEMTRVLLELREALLCR